MYLATYTHPNGTDTHTVQVTAPSTEDAESIADNYRKMVNPELETWDVDVSEA